MPERAFKRRLIEQAHIRTGQIVLDLGCGTATLTMMLKRAHPDAKVIGLDGDPRILAIAARKVAAVGVDVLLDCGMSFELPYRDRSVDRVLSSLLFHHLSQEDKRRTLAECHRVLRAGGELHIADWGKPHNALTLLASWSVRFFDGLATTADNVGGRLPRFCREAGFDDVAEISRFAPVFGTLSLYSARASRRPKNRCSAAVKASTEGYEGKCLLAARPIRTCSSSSGPCDAYAKIVRSGSKVIRWLRLLRA